MPNPIDARRPTPDRNLPPLRWWITALVSAAIAIVAVLLLNSCSEQGPASADNAAARKPKVTSSAMADSPFTNTNGITTMEAAQSVVVTHDLDVGPGATTLAEVIRNIERYHKPEDGAGRTFSILEAFNGAIQPDGKMRVSLRVSSEKPGLGAIIYRRATEPLWMSRITPATNKPPFTGSKLTILFDVGDGKSFTVDGSTGPSSILTAMLKEPGVQIGPIWPEGEVRELTFIYSACGCPIKVKCRRAGERTVRIDTAQVIFPDDPAATQLISNLMRW